MKFNRFNKKNCQNKRNGIAAIRINEKGLISFSWKLYQMLNPEGKELIYVEFLQNQDSPKDWYIIRSTEEEGFPLRGKKDTKSSMFNSAALTKQLIELVRQPGDDRTRFTLRVIDKPQQLAENMEGWLLITKPLS